MPNTFAYVMLLGWPVVVVLLFRFLPLHLAFIWSILGGYLILPSGTGFNLPMIPYLDKSAIPALAAAVVGLIAARRGASGPRRAAPRRERAAPVSRRAQAGARNAAETAAAPPEAAAEPARRRDPLLLLLLGLLFATPLLTYLQNRGGIVVGERFLPGLAVYDALSSAGYLLFMVLPFLLARRFLATPEAHLALLKSLVLALLAYSFLVLFEVRMSPQLHNWVYGFFQHSFVQHIRGEGFRPLVFLPHGLWLAVLLAMTSLAAVVLWRESRGPGRLPLWLLAALWLAGTLALSRSFGALVLALAFLPVVLFLRRRTQMLVAAVVAVVVLFYPMLRGADLVPVDAAYRAALAVDAERAESLRFRLDNEDLLLARANEKPLVGWGGWGRSRVYDPDSGRDLSVTDSAWIILIGTSGWLGYIAQFGLLTLPALMLWRRRRRLGVTLATSGLALVLSVNLVDMLLNGTLTPVTWMVAGALAGRAALVAAEAEGEAETAAPARGGARGPGGHVRRPRHGPAPATAAEPAPAEGAPEPVPAGLSRPPAGSARTPHRYTRQSRR